ncbi:VOC family protein [Sphingoaurantiacus capsulatus]|uniref:VOC family protein n=1 Tax=Sphingoaurantiacus capsulatus TaxID=1771310 RepID=A0ABV7XAH9_9SPHN
MPKMIFVNLPVADLAKSRAFYEALGATNEPKFTDETGAAMMLSDVIGIMLLTHDKFRQFNAKAISDARTSCEVINCFSVDSRSEVDAVVEKAGGAGGRADAATTQDYGFMYSRSVEDPDGHIWEVMWMDPVAAENGPPAVEA